METLTSLVIVLFIFSQAIFAQKNCGTSEYLEKVRLEYPATSFKNSLLYSAPQSSNTGSSSSELSSETVITIPVVVHVLFNSSVNVSDEQIKSQIDALNKNFNKENEDFSKVPAAFAGVAGVANFRFELAKVDPNGRATNGITRTKSARELWTKMEVSPCDQGAYVRIGPGTRRSF